jgi:thiamine pyrophosphate-dependent acetolactate synthase large subunit-like protein
MWMFKISDPIIEAAKKAGVGRVCHSPGDPRNGPTDALRWEGMLSPGTFRRNMLAAFVAAADAPLSGELAVCRRVVPGNLHLSYGPFDASRSRWRCRRSPPHPDQGDRHDVLPGDSAPGHVIAMAAPGRIT